jgi:rhomboid family GlyGly-CTERM serine protease
LLFNSQGRLLETIRNYNAPSPLFLRVAFSFAIGILAISGQVFAPDFAQQGLDLIDSFFIYLLVAQFTHLGWVHLGLNLAGLAIVAWGFSAQRSHAEWLWVQLVSLFWLAFYLSWVEPVQWYCGLSGALHFQFAACLLMALYRSPSRLAQSWPLWVLAAGLVAKLVLEWNSGHTTDSMVGGPIAFEAHRGGALGGVLFGVAMIGRSIWRKPYSAS